jgi:hypothetical protein
MNHYISEVLTVLFMRQKEAKRGTHMKTEEKREYLNLGSVFFFSVRKQTY